MTSPAPQPPPNVTSVTAPSSADPTTAAAIVSSNQSANLSAATTISSMSDLRNKAPKVYNMMMQGIAFNIINDMQQHEEHLEELMKQIREADG